MSHGDIDSRSVFAVSLPMCPSVHRAKVVQVASRLGVSMLGGLHRPIPVSSIHGNPLTFYSSSIGALLSGSRRLTKQHLVGPLAATIKLSSSSSDFLAQMPNTTARHPVCILILLTPRRAR